MNNGYNFISWQIRQKFLFSGLQAKKYRKRCLRHLSYIFIRVLLSVLSSIIASITIFRQAGSNERS